MNKIDVVYLMLKVDYPYILFIFLEMDHKNLIIQIPIMLTSHKTYGDCFREM